MPPLSNLAVRDIETLVHPYTNLATLRETGPLILERGQGVFVYDSEGKAYIEGMAGLWCTALGYGNEELVEAAAAQMRKLPFGHLFTAKSHDPAIELAERLKEIAPVPTSKVFFCSSGSEANDTPGQARLVHEQRARPAEKEEDHQPSQGLSRRDRRGGLAHGAAQQSPGFRSADRRHFARRLSAPLPLRAGRARAKRSSRGGWRTNSKRLICAEDPDTVAAFIAEPVMGAGGVIVPPKAYFAGDHEGLPEVRRVHDLGRGDLRLRPARNNVRLHGAWVSSRTRSRSPRP